jgi:hypothetical protein
MSRKEDILDRIRAINLTYEANIGFISCGLKNLRPRWQAMPQHCKSIFPYAKMWSTMNHSLCWIGKAARALVKTTEEYRRNICPSCWKSAVPAAVSAMRCRTSAM